MLKPLFLLYLLKKKIHSVSGCDDWVLLGSPSFIVHSKYISLMDLTCGRINSFFLLRCHQITATLQIKQNLLSHWLPEFIVSWNHLLSQVHRLHFASFFFFATNHDNQSCGQVCLLSPFRRRSGVFASCRIPWCKPTALDQLLEEDSIVPRWNSPLYKMPLDSA